jgi:chromate transport protein ChrA
VRQPVGDPTPARESLWSLFLIFLRLGLTSFGGPVAHLGYFREEFVTRRRWLGERAYADLVALCQFLPGPASSQVGMAIGLVRHGYRGAFAAWAGFTLPSALAMILFALGLARHGDLVPAGALHGLKIVAVAVVAQAVPGPLFTFAAFLGASLEIGPSGWAGGLLCLAAIFAPSFLLVAGALPFWEQLRHNARMRAALAGINAGVVGVLLAALYDPVWVQAIAAPRDFALALLAFVALVFWRLPPWLVVLACGAAGAMAGLELR